MLGETEDCKSKKCISEGEKKEARQLPDLKLNEPIIWAIKCKILIKEDYVLTKLDKKTAESEEVRVCFFLFIPSKIVHLHHNCINIIGKLRLRRKKLRIIWKAKHLRVYIVVMAIGVVVSPLCMAIFISHVDHRDTLVINSSAWQRNWIMLRMCINVLNP